MYVPDSVTSFSTVSASSTSASSRELLFGEIESVTTCHSTTSLRSNTSKSSLTFSSSSTFLKLWLCDSARDAVLSHVSQPDLTNLRLVCHEFSNRVAPILFQNVSATFRSKTFTKPARLAALDRIGHHIKSFSLSIRHGDETCLAPLIDPDTGEEVPFVYEPQTYSPATLIEKVKNPKYGSWMLADLLIKQYPPLFHAATNVPSFIRAFSSMCNLTHLCVSCPGKDATQPSRRSIVDYCLISLRIAIERANMDKLCSMTLSPIHADGLFYLQPTIGFGSSPKATKRWAQIHDLKVHVSCGDGASTKTSDSMKILHAFLRNFSCVKKLHFRWDGNKGPCPVSLDSELHQNTSSEQEAANFKLRRLKFGNLEQMVLENAMMDATQVSKFIGRHRRTLNTFRFEDVQLRSGNWAEALAPFSDSRTRCGARESNHEAMDVPVFLSPEDWDEIDGNTARNSQVGHKRATSSLCRLWSKAKGRRTSIKAKEHLMSGSEHMKKLLSYSVFGWR